MQKLMKMALGAVMMAGGATMGAGALSTPAQARVTIGVGIGVPGYYGYYGPGYYGYYGQGYYGPGYSNCWYSPYGCGGPVYRPYYYGTYYGPNVWYRPGWEHRYYRRGHWDRR